MGRNLAGVPASDKALERGPLARSFPTLKQDDRPFAMDNLRQLQLGKPILQRG
jgi:hypothetical protein